MEVIKDIVIVGIIEEIIIIKMTEEKEILIGNINKGLDQGIEIEEKVDIIVVGIIIVAGINKNQASHLVKNLVIIIHYILNLQLYMKVLIVFSSIFYLKKIFIILIYIFLMVNNKIISYRIACNSIFFQKYIIITTLVKN